MLKNYLKIAWRNLRSRKVYSAINIIGLATGLAACLLIGLYVHDELSYDDFHENADRTYRVLREFDIPDLQTTISTTPSALAPALEENLPAVEKAIRVLETNPVVAYGSQKFVESSFLVSEKGFFELFSFPFIRGEASLDRPSTVVISEEMATKYFSGENPIGKSLRVGSDDLEVTGIFASVPENSHLQFDFVASLDEPDLNWGRNNYTTYVLVQEGQSKDVLTSQVADLIQTRTDPENQQSGNGFIPHLQPLTGIHLGQGVTVDIWSQGSMMYVYLFIVLAVFIVLLACINYMNLATARSTERAREVGLRKTLGAGRGQVAGQFLGESVLITLFSLFLAFALCQTSLPFLNSLAGKSLELESLSGGPEALLIVGIAILIGIAAGLYPSLILSGFKPSRVVKGEAGIAGSSTLRKGLVVFQFAISTALIAATGVVYQQLGYMKSSDLGFDQENLLLIDQVNFIGERASTFKEQLKSLPGVEEVTSGFSVPGNFFINSMWTPSESGAQAQNLDYTFVDFNYVETLDLEIVAGRSFSRDYSTDSTGAIMNVAAVNDFGWTPQEAIGKKIGQGEREFTIIGVTDNFHYRSLHAEVYPLALFGPQKAPWYTRYVAARISSRNVPQTLEEVGQKWSEFSELPFEYTFLADDLAAQYRSEDKLADVFSVFATLSIIIACMGLFGLAAFMASRRTKEIGIRKVLGATVANIIGLLSKDFLKLVALGFIIAVPIAWYAMNQWLVNFAYHIDIGAGIFLLSGATALFIALATISWQSIRAATMNPVESLRSD